MRTFGLAACLVLVVLATQHAQCAPDDAEGSAGHIRGQAPGKPHKHSFQYDSNLAHDLVHFQSIAYCHDFPSLHAWNCTRCSAPAVKDFVLWEVVKDESWDLLAYVGWAPRLKAKMAVFRGTDGLDISNWIDNLRIAKLNGDFPGAPASVKLTGLAHVDLLQVHSGFYHAWSASALKPNVTAALTGKGRGLLEGGRGDEPLIIVGHSLGGAIGTIASLELKLESGYSNVTLYTYGSPRVGNPDWAEFFRLEMPRTIRMTHSKDVVPSLPYQHFGFHHVAREVYTYELPLVKRGEPTILAERVCDDSGEDPTCEDAACFLGLCRSIYDHLHYLNIDVSSNGSC